MTASSIDTKAAGVQESALVTGAGGFLGSCLTVRLAERGVRVIAASRRPMSPGPYASRLCDVEDAEAVARLVDDTRPTTIFHLASHVRGSRELSAVLPTFRANLASAVHVLTAACQFECRRVVLAASAEELPLDQPARSPYAAAKRAASEYARFFRSAYGLSVVSARIGMAYGPGQRDATKLVPYVILEQLAARAPRLTSGSRRADWVYVEDVIEALIACMTAPDIEGEVVEIGTGRATSVGEVAARLTARMAGVAPEMGALPDRANEADIVANVDETARRIGWRAKVGLDEGLRRTIDWYRAERAAGRV
jgi:UDP-glucose 4-epimerase